MHPYIVTLTVIFSFQGILFVFMQAVEKFSSNIEKMELTLATLLQKFENSSTPNDVVNTEKQILEHSVQRKELLEDFDSSVEYGQTLLSCIKGDSESTALVQLAHVQEVER